MQQEWTVGPAAELLGSTVRTLHHYDAIGLVVASGRSWSGYRRYTSDDLDRLRHVLVYRELGFSLDRIRDLLDADPSDRLRHLREQLDAVGDRIERLQRVRVALEQEMEADMGGTRLTQDEKRELFGDDWLGEEYEAEAEQRWGDTDAWAQSRRRTRSYDKADWQRIKDEGAEVERRFVALLTAGEPAGSVAAMDVAEQAREHLSRWFYDCPPEMHAGLGRMYVEDERFTAYYERQAAGLAEFVSTAVLANSRRQAGQPDA